jgi:hypothetical protein
MSRLLSIAQGVLAAYLFTALINGLATLPH